jgi:biotin-(acetyl-CoA carboxylase) ligase
MKESKSEEISKIATSVYNELKKKISREILLSKVLNNIEILLEKDFETVLKEYKKYDILLGNEIIVMPKKKEDESSYYNAKAIDFDENGFLVIEKDFKKLTLSNEEVSIRLKF